MEAQTLSSPWQFTWFPLRDDEKCHHPLSFITRHQFVDLLCSDLEVNFESDEKAYIVYAALNVDKELQPDKVKRVMSISNGKLAAHFEAVEARFLRASFSAFVDVLTLATRTIEEFSPEKGL